MRLWVDGSTVLVGGCAGQIEGSLPKFGMISLILFWLEYVSTDHSSHPLHMPMAGPALLGLIAMGLF